MRIISLFNKCWIDFNLRFLSISRETRQGMTLKGDITRY